MSTTDSLSAPGSAIYSTSTLYVGDGTWDSTRNSFLLPNLMGLNFATMQYNGMGNRFRDLPQYHSLILGHGVMAAIVFVLVVPSAIFIAKYGHGLGRNAYKLHVYLHILTLFLSTIVLILGWFAVGPERSLTNPHHGIGVAIYVWIWFQFIWGWRMSRIEKKRKEMPRKIPLKVWLHKIMGRSLAVLGFIQLALGLTLYGSPLALFVLYALAGFILLFLYLALDYYYKDKVGGGGQPAPGSGYYSDYGSYVTGTQMTQDQRPPRENSHWGRNILMGVGALGAYEAYKSRRDRKRAERQGVPLDNSNNHNNEYDTPGRPPIGNGLTPITPNRLSRHRHGDALPPDSRHDRPGATESRLSPESWEYDEKYDRPQKHTWRDRILGAGAGVVAFEGARRLFGRKKHDEDVYDDRPRPPGAVHHTDVSQVEAGQPPLSPDDPRRHGAAGQPLPSTGARPHGAPYATDSHSDGFYDDGRPHTLRDSIAVYGALSGFQNWMAQRRQRRQRGRYDEHASEYDERFDRPGVYPNVRPGAPSMSTTDLSGVTHEQHNNTTNRPDVNHPPLPANAGAIPIGTGLAAGALAGAATGALVGGRHSRHDITQTEYTLPPPPPGPPPHGSASRLPIVPGSAHMPPGAIEPDPGRLLADNTTANESSAYGRGSRLGPAEAGAAGLAAGMLAGRAGRTQSESPSRYSRTNRQDLAAAGPSTIPPAGMGPGAASSPPISLKINMHNDSGGHVTLRRLNEQEAAAERAARRRQRRAGARRNSSLSSGMDDEPAPPRFRRNEAVLPSASQPISNIPPPPAMSSAAGSGRRDSELNLPPSLHQQSVQQSPPTRPILQSPPVSSPPYPQGSGPTGSGMISPGPYATDAGTGTDVSAFADNRRRRRAERARRQQAGNGPRVEFE